MRGADMQAAEMAEPPAKASTKTDMDPVVAELRAKLFAGLAPVGTFAAVIDRTDRQVRHYIAAGMPTTYVGKTPYVVVEAAIDWLRSRRKRDREPRPRGRPRKSNTA